METIEELRYEAMWEGVIRLVIEFSILYAIFFIVLGRNTNIDSANVFYIGFFFIVVFLIPLEVVNNLRAKLLFGANDQQLPNHKVENSESLEILRNPWESLLPYTVVIAIAGSLFYYFSSDFFMDYPAWVFASIFLAITMISVLLLIYFLDWGYFTHLYRLLDGEEKNLYVKHEEIGEYYVMRHILPWGMIIVALSFVVAYKTYQEMLFSFGTLSVSDTAFSVGSTCFVVGIWLWHESKLQAQADIALGVVRADHSESLSHSDLFFCFSAISMVSIGVVFLFGFLFQAEGFSLTIAIGLHMLLAVISGFCGNILGVIWSFNHSPISGQAKLH